MQNDISRPPQRIFNADLVEKSRKPAGKLTQLKAGTDPEAKRRGGKPAPAGTKPPKLPQSGKPTPTTAPPAVTPDSSNAPQSSGQDVKTASNINADPKELIALAKSSNPDVLLALASNTATPTKVLLSLVKKKDSALTVALVRNPAFPASKYSLILPMAKTNRGVRTALKSRRNLPTRIIKALSKIK